MSSANSVLLEATEVGSHNLNYSFTVFVSLMGKYTGSCLCLLDGGPIQPSYYGNHSRQPSGTAVASDLQQETRGRNRSHCYQQEGQFHRLAGRLRGVIEIMVEDEVYSKHMSNHRGSEIRGDSPFCQVTGSHTNTLPIKCLDITDKFCFMFAWERWNFIGFICCLRSRRLIQAHQWIACFVSGMFHGRWFQGEERHC